MRCINRVLAIAQIATFAITATTSIPLLVSYLRNTSPMNPVFIHLHSWFGLAFITIAILKIIERKNVILSQLGLKLSKGKKNS